MSKNTRCKSEMEILTKDLGICGNGMSGNSMSGNGMSGNGMSGNGENSSFRLSNEEFEELINELKE